METMIEAGSGMLWSEDTGGAGEPVVLVHPGIHDATVWDPVLGLLGGLRLIRYDARGFGRSPVASERFRAVDDLERVLDHVGVERAHLVGNSMGGQACLALAVTQPDRVASLTLLAPGISGYDWPDDAPDLEEAYAAAKGDRAAMIEVQLRLWCACGVDASIRAQVGAAYDADLVQDDLEDPAPEQWSRVGAITVPTTVMIGLDDLASMVTGSRALAAAVPGAELVELPGVDHLPSLRAPEAVAAAVRSTVARAG